jgi:hypothetical protein
LALVGGVSPAQAALMRYSFKGDYSKTPKKGFDWLLGAQLEGYMDWDTEANDKQGAFTAWGVRSYRTAWQQDQERIGKEIKDLEAKIALIDDTDKLDEALGTAETAKEQAESDLLTIEASFKKAETEAKRKLLDSQVLVAKTNQEQIESRIQELSDFKADIAKSGAEKVKSSLEARVNDLRERNGGFGGLNSDPARPEILMDLSSSAENSSCFASPIGAGSALRGGIYSEGPAGSSLCGGTNGGMNDELLANELGQNPIYFSVIQYLKDPNSGTQSNFAFRLAFIPNGEEGGEKVVGFSAEPNTEGLFQSEPWYGTSFRFGGSQADLRDGVASCGGNPATYEALSDPNGPGWVTSACPFAPDELGEVAGNTFLSNLEFKVKELDSGSTAYRYSGGGEGEENEGGEGHEGGGHCNQNSVASYSSSEDNEGGEGGEGGGCTPSQAPAPLPILGAGAAFAWSRRVRRRYGVVIPATVAAGR